MTILFNICARPISLDLESLLMTDAEIELRYLVALGLAHEAGALAMTYANDRARMATRMKGRQDFLTEADGAVEAMLRSRLARLFPGDGFVGEEDGGEGAENLWIVDPIDGTANFARGDIQWCISIGFVHKLKPVVGVIHAPVLGETFAARKGAGATLNGLPIHVSNTSRLDNASIEIGWSARRRHQEYIDLVGKVCALGASAKRSASGALGMAWVACGRTDAYLELHINSWDVAAGMVIVHEAGGVVNDFFMGDGLTQGNPILATTPTFETPLRVILGLNA
jgi:myo-inositol-1(or 4)-monophosphatase